MDDGAWSLSRPCLARVVSYVLYCLLSVVHIPVGIAVRRKLLLHSASPQSLDNDAYRP